MPEDFPLHRELDEAPYGRGRHQVDCSVDSHGTATKQSFKEDCDINRIMARWMKGEHPMHIAKIQPIFGGFHPAADLQEAFEVVANAEEAFAALPAAVRDAVENDPRNLEAFLADEANAEFLAAQGVLSTPPPEPPGPPSPPEPSSPAPPGEAPSPPTPPAEGE